MEKLKSRPSWWWWWSNR